MFLSKIIEFLKKGGSGLIEANLVKDSNIESAASIEYASKNQITFLEKNNSLKGNISSTKASAIIIYNDEELIESFDKRNISINLM